MQNPLRIGFAVPCILLLCAFTVMNPSFTRACDRTDVSLDSIVQVGQEYDIYLTLRVGAGLLGVSQGADQATGAFAFGFYSCADSVNFSFFTPSITGDSTGNTLSGINVGPVPQAPYMTQGFILYQSPSSAFYTCVHNTNICGVVHTQIEQFRFRTDVIPDSIRAFGLEGGGNPIGGCYLFADMVISFPNATACANDTVPPVITCPSGFTPIYDCILPDLTSLVTVTDNLDPNPTITQNPPAGSPFFGLPPATVTFTATDASGNSDSCTITIALSDTVPPIANCQNITVQLDSLGNAGIGTADLDNGSADNCGNSTLSLSDNQFDCADLGANSVTLIISDQSGNADSATCTVTVEDSRPPIAICQAITVNLGASGAAVVPVNAIGGQSTDNCGIAQISSSKDSVSCADLGGATILITVLDSSGNSDTCNAAITTMDALPPQITCPPSPSVSSQAGQCGSAVFWTPPQPTDNCSIASLTSSANSGDFFPVGSSFHSYTATDGSGNSALCFFTVNVTGFPLSLGVSVDTFFNGLSIACHGDSTGIARSSALDGCPPYTYQWSNGSTADTAVGLPAGWVYLTVIDSGGSVISDSIFLTEPTPLSSNLPTTLSACSGGGLTFPLVVNGGSPIRNYCVSPFGSSTQTCYPEQTPGTIPVGPLPAGDYVAVLIDSLGCESLDTFSVDSLPLPIVNLPPPITVCVGESVNLDAGNPGNSYQWSTGDTTQMISTLLAGPTSVIVTDSNGCMGTGNTQILNWAQNPPGASAMGGACMGDTIFLSANSNFNFYQWTGPGGFFTSFQNPLIVSMLGPGTYTYYLEVEDGNGCTIYDSVQVTTDPEPIVNLGPDLLLCDGDSATLDAGNPGLSFLWNTGDSVQQITVSNASIYAVTVATINGCERSDSLETTLGTIPQSLFGFSAGSGNQTFDFMNLSTGTIDSVLWDWDDGTFSNQSNPTHTFINPGHYTVCLLTFGPCGNDTSCQTLGVTNVAQGFNVLDLQVVPNPNAGQFKVVWDRPLWQDASLSIWDLRGKLIREEKSLSGSQEHAFDLETLPAGMFLFCMREGDSILTQRIVIEK